MIGLLLGGAVLAGGAWALTRKKKVGPTSGSITYSNGWIGDWRIAKIHAGAWLGQFRISQQGFGQATETGWLNVPHGMADTAAHARSLAKEQLAIHDPANPNAAVVDSGTVTKGATVWHWAVLKMMASGLYRPLVGASPDGTPPPDDQWQAIAPDRLKPQEARNLCLEFIAAQA